MTFIKAMALDITPENSLRRVSRLALATAVGEGAADQATVAQADQGEVAESFVVFLSGVYGSPYKVKQSLQGAGISLDGLVGQIGRPPKGSGGGAKRQLKFTEHRHTVIFMKQVEKIYTKVNQNIFASRNGKSKPGLHKKSYADAVTDPVQKVNELKQKVKQKKAQGSVTSPSSHRSRRRLSAGGTRTPAHASLATTATSSTWRRLVELAAVARRANAGASETPAHATSVMTVTSSTW